ncbi:MAG: hypothetical protein ACT4PV_09675 [Planctomycetaceae bacterium]
MTAISQSQIKDLALAAASELVVDKLPTNDLQRVLPFVAIDGYELKLAGVDAAGSLASHAGIETEGGSLVATIPSLATRTHALSRISAVLEAYTITQDKYNSVADILETLLDLKARAVRDVFCVKFYRGDSTVAGEFDGLNKLATSYSQEFGANNDAADGGTVQKKELPRLRALVQVNRTAAEIVYVMHASAFQHLLAVSYSDIEFVNHPILGMVPALVGTPILFDNYISLTETKGSGTNLTSIFCIALGRGVGVTGIVPRGGAGGDLRIRGPITHASTGILTYQVSWDVGIAIWNKAGFARMNGVAWQNVT